MDTLQKKLLGWGGFGLMVLLGAFLIVKTNQEFNTAATTNTVTFSGRGEVLAKPDVALVDLSIVTEGSTSKIAQDENSKKSKAVTDFLKDQDIDEKDIKTTGYNIYPQYRYPQNGTPTISGYQVNQTLQVKIRDLEKVDDVLAGIVSAGVNQINQLQLTVDDQDKLKEEAREEAIKDAQEKAKVLEDQLDIRLGRIVNFSEGSDGSFPSPVFMRDSAVGGMGGGGPSVPVGQNEISVTVSITYQIR